MRMSVRLLVVSEYRSLTLLSVYCEQDYKVSAMAIVQCVLSPFEIA